MKKFAIFFISGVILAFGSCSDLEQIDQEQGSITAIMEGSDTRTSVTDEGTFTWSEGDRIWLQTTNGSIVGTLSDGEGTPNANFSYGASIGGTLTGKAIYPYNAGHAADDDAVAVVLPASYELGSFLNNTNAAMYGVNSNGTIKFNHLAGVMRFSFKNVPAGVDRFAITMDKKINGTFEANLAADYPVLETIATDVEAEKTVELNFDALAETSDIKLYVPLPLGTYTTLGLELFKGETSVWTYSNTVTNTVNRKILKLMPTVTLGGSIGGEIEGEEPPSGQQPGDYVDEYGINHGQGIKIGETVWAPVNCGYHATDYKWGKLYQWGRKYGQGYDGDATTPELSRGGVSLTDGQSESNKNVFFKYSEYFGDWLSQENYQLWNSGTEESPEKTEYDPCPAGWRVPTYAELNELRQNYSSWTTYVNGQNGYWFSGISSYSSDVAQLFLPTAGRRYYDDGEADSRGSSGNYWSSRCTSSYAITLYFHSSGFVSILSDRIRAHGFSVRCVQE